MTTWDSGHKATAITLSNSNLTATQNSSATSWNSVISTTGKSSGKFYCKFTTIGVDASNGFILGVGDSTTTITAGSYIGIDAHSAGLQAGGAATYGFTGSPGGGVSFTNGDTLLLAVDRDNKKAWLRVSGTWSGTDDPSANTGGSTWTFGGDVYLGWAGFDGGGTTDTITMDPSALDADTKLSGFSPWDANSANLNYLIPPITVVGLLSSGQAYSVNTTIAPIISVGTFTHFYGVVVNKTIDSITSAILSSSPRNISLSQTLSIGPFLRIVPIPFPSVSLDPFHDPIWVAFEADIFDADNNPITIRMGNRGTIRRTVDGVLYQYSPRLSEVPIQLGATINVTQYGSPVRVQPNAGSIHFLVDEAIWAWFGYRWIGHVFRVYEGQSVDPVQTDVDEDLTLVYQGRIVSIQHDTLSATIGTTDESLQWDNPLVGEYFSNAYHKTLRGKPRPYLWGLVYNLEPVLIDEASQLYEVSARLGAFDCEIYTVYVGGIPWRNNVAGPPEQGEWTATLGRFVLGSPPLGMDVRCDARQGRFTLAQLIASLIQGPGGTVDPTVMGRLDSVMPPNMGYVTGVNLVNRLDAIDDVVTNAGCWWGCGPLGLAIAGVIDVPATNATQLFDETIVKSISLNIVHPPAKIIRIGAQRNWAPQTSFAPSVLQTEQKRLSDSGLVYEPHYENTTLTTLEPRAVEVPQLKSTLESLGDVPTFIQGRLVQAWGTARSLFDVQVYPSLSDINLYDTVALDYMMVTGNFRVTSIIRAIGLGPASLQLWGTIGPFDVQPPQPILPSAGITDVGIWTRSSGSGTFEIGVDTPATVTRIWVRGVGAGGGGAGANTSGGLFYGGGGGGAGGYFEDVLTVTASSAIGWSVGEGGAGMAFGVFGTADTGGDTTFGGFTANGGVGGQVGTLSVDGGQGGGSSGATVTIQGGTGGVGYIVANPPTFDIFTGNGASSIFGEGKHASTTLEASTSAPGSGGGGHVSPFSAPSSDGAHGQIIVLWFVE